MADGHNSALSVIRSPDCGHTTASRRQGFVFFFFYLIGFNENDTPRLYTISTCGDAVNKTHRPETCETKKREMLRVSFSLYNDKKKTTCRQGYEMEERWA